MHVRKNRSEGSNLPGVYYAQTGAHFKERGWIARIEVQVEVMGMTLQQKDVVKLSAGRSISANMATTKRDDWRKKSGSARCLRLRTATNPLFSVPTRSRCIES